MKGFAEIYGFMRAHPDLFRLLQGFPKLSGETGRLLLRFLERALRERSPDRFVRESIEDALSKPQAARVEVVDVRPGLKKR